MEVRIAVIGAGVIGLSTAYKILCDVKDCEVTIFADQFSPFTTGDTAAGLLEPYACGNHPKNNQWFKATLDHLSELYKLPDSFKIGLQPALVYILDTPLPDFADVLPHAVLLTRKECLSLHYPVVDSAIKINTWMCSCLRYLPWLSSKVSKRGGKFVNRHINSFEELSDYDVIVNCTGISAIQLTNDPKMIPIRGQVIRVKAPWIKHAVIQDDYYVMPRVDDVILGGTFQKGNRNLKIDPNDRNKIWEKCCQLVPSIKHAEIIEERVGLRPYREAIRLEVEEKFLNGKQVAILHNYGHGGSGISLHWGCAVEASTLLQSYLKKKRLTSNL